jgi:hypothetical protein
MEGIHPGFGPSLVRRGFEEVLSVCNEPLVTNPQALRLKGD